MIGLAYDGQKLDRFLCPYDMLFWTRCYARQACTVRNVECLGLTPRRGASDDPCFVSSDIVGRAARHEVIEQVPALRKEHALDFLVVNCENAAGGFGVTPKICDALFDAGLMS